MDNCSFCQASNGKVLFSNEYLLVIFASPASTQGHIKVMPKKHFTIFEQIPQDLIKILFDVANQFSTILFEALSVQGTNVIVQNGNAAGQTVPHFSIDVLPRREGDGLRLNWQPRKVSEDQLISLENRLKYSIVEAEFKDEPSPREPKLDKIDPPEDEFEIEEDYQIKQLERIP